MSLDDWLMKWIPLLAGKAHRRWPFAEREDIEQTMWLYAYTSKAHCEALLTRGPDGERILSFELDKAITRAQEKSDNGYQKAIREITGEAYANPYHGKMLNHLTKSLVRAGMAVDGAVEAIEDGREGGRVDTLAGMLEAVRLAYSALQPETQETISAYYREGRPAATDAERQRAARAMKQLRWTLYRRLKETEPGYYWDEEEGDEEMAA